MMETLINNKKTEATEFGYDGCHKIYLVESDNDRRELLELEYTLLPISDLQDVWNDSCSLKFISSGDLSHNYVNQFEQATIKQEA